MKRVIKWLSEVTGVADKIREENTKFIGCQMSHYSHWFSGGLASGKYDAGNALEKYSRYLIKGNTHLFCGQSDQLREELFKLSQENERVHK